MIPVNSEMGYVGSGTHRPGTCPCALCPGDVLPCSALRAQGNVTLLALTLSIAQPLSCFFLQLSMHYHMA